jgi:hypothetical protein
MIVKTVYHLTAPKYLTELGLQEQGRNFIPLLVQNLKEHSNLTINTEINTIINAVQVHFMEHTVYVRKYLLFEAN